MAVELEMANGRFGIAARELTRLLLQNPDDGEAAILLGRCEQERGRFRAAAEALARVAPGSDLAHKAILARMRIAHDQGQLSAAEQLISEAANDPRNDGDHLRVLLVPIFSQLGRLDEAAHLLEAWWERLNALGEGASERAIDQVRMRIELALKPNPVDNVRAYLDAAGKMAPDDDRIWLGRANLAIRTGDYIAAGRWLDSACSDARTIERFGRRGSSSEWRATETTSCTKPCRTSLPTRSRPLGFGQSWPGFTLAGMTTTANAGHSSNSLPSIPAISRPKLGSPSWPSGAGQQARAQQIRDKLSEIASLRARYELLFDRNQPVRDAEELARIAERLGRIFEARAFLALEIAEDPDRDDLRRDLAKLNRTHATQSASNQSLADAVAALMAGPATTGERLTP